MKIYTKTGDKGETSLVSGRRVSKADFLIEAYGVVDELNSFAGDFLNSIKEPAVFKDMNFIQNILFNIGSLLAKDEADFPNFPTIETGDIEYLEKRIDLMNAALPKMTAFILPSGSESISKAHICRTVCRRAERAVIRVAENGEFELIIQYLNRLSDYFFILARWFHLHNNIPEIKWDNNIRSHYNNTD